MGKFGPTQRVGREILKPIIFINVRDKPYKNINASKAGQQKTADT